MHKTLLRRSSLKNQKQKKTLKSNSYKALQVTVVNQVLQSLHGELTYSPFKICFINVDYVDCLVIMHQQI